MNRNPDAENRALIYLLTVCHTLFYTMRIFMSTSNVEQYYTTSNKHQSKDTQT